MAAVQQCVAQPFEFDVGEFAVEAQPLGLGEQVAGDKELEHGIRLCHPSTPSSSTRGCPTASST